MTRLHWASIGANGTGLLMCLWAWSQHPEYAKGLALLVVWMLWNLAVSTTALRRKG